ncbi:MAG: hypothetical protein MUE69_31995 [Myxococcota bacterium]|jgi:hypothetical protein|nr:hypothetical protein [Myxococcota bacterium]
MAKGKKQKPKKRVARRVDDELEQGGVGEGAEGADESGDELDEGADAEGFDDSEQAGSDEAAEPSEPPVAARAAEKSAADPADQGKKSEREPKARPSAKSKDLPTEMPVTQTSEKGPVVFLAVIGVLLAFAIAVGFLTN